MILFDGTYYEIDNVREHTLVGGQPEIYDQESGSFDDSRMVLTAVAFMVRRSQIQIDERIYH